MTNSWAALPAPTQKGQVGGHEGVGKVVKLGPGAESSGVKIGDRVGVKWVSAICESNAERHEEAWRFLQFKYPGRLTML